jgi:hypothetical protein
VIARTHHKTRQIHLTIILSCILLLSSIFTTWQAHAKTGSTMAVDDVVVTGVTRISHPAYKISNVWYSLRNPWNRDYTRLLMFESSSFTHPIYGTKGRRLVWGFVGQLKEFGTQFDGLDESDPEDIEILKSLLPGYHQVARPVPDTESLKPTSAYWSPFPGEENILYAIKYNDDRVFKIDVDTEEVTPIISFDPGDGTDITNARSFGWTEDNTLIVNFNDEGEGDGYEIDVEEMTRIRYSALPDMCSSEGRRFPDQGHGHSSRSPSGTKQAVDYGYTSDNGVRDLMTCEFYEDLAYENRLDEPYPRYTVYASWKASEEWFLASSSQFREGSADPTPSYLEAPEIVSYAMWQVYFDPDGDFEYREILRVRTASRWDPDSDHNNGNRHLNYHAHLIPVLREDGRQIWYTATDGKHTYEDYSSEGVTPWGTEGAYLADLAPAYDVPTFSDVPFDHWAYAYIEALYQAGYVAGCSTDPLLYCPEDILTRAESAVFVERGIHGAEALPDQPTQRLFDDVPLEEWFAMWTNALWKDGYTSGCGTDPLIYCPLQEHTRAEGSVFFLRMMQGMDYIPPDPTGLFIDVPAEAWYADWAEAAYKAGIIPACETEPELRFCPEDPLDRAMAAYMMVRAKNLSTP